MSKESKDYCPNCRVTTNHISLFITKEKSNDEDDFHWSEDYEVIKCKGCENIQYRTTYSDITMYEYSEDEGTVYYDEKKYFPKNLNGHKILSNAYNIPNKIRIVYIETVEAMKNNCYLLSAVGLRAIIEAISIELKINGRNLEQKINSLARNKYITEKDSGRLHSIRFLGNDSVHEMQVPKEDKLNIALRIVENLINSLYLIDIEADKHLDTIITDYEIFKSHFSRKFWLVKQSEEKSIKELFGSEYRRIETSYIDNFTQQLIEDINSGIIKNINVGDIKISTIENIPVQHFVKK